MALGAPRGCDTRVTPIADLCYASTCAAILALAGCARTGDGAAHRVPAVEEAESDREVVLSPTQLAHAGVQVARLDLATFAPRVYAPATIVLDPAHLARIGPRVLGRVVAVNVQLGSVVHRGETLIELEALESRQTTAEYVTNLARVRESRLALDRARRLVVEGAGSRSEQERAEADTATAEARLRESEQHLRMLGLESADVARLQAPAPRGSSRSRIVAPIDGRVTTLDVGLGQIVNATDVMATIANLARLWVSARVPEREIGRIVLGAAVDVRVAGDSERTLQSTLTFVGDIADPSSRTVEARAVLDDAAANLRPGMSASVFIATAHGSPVMLLPEGAVQSIHGRPAVFVQTALGHFEPRPIVAGEAHDGLVAVDRGVAVGDLVVTQGAFTLRGEFERASLGEE